MHHITFILIVALALPYFNKKLPMYIFSFGILLIFMSLRFDFGNDYMAYLKSYEIINQGGISPHVGSSFLYRLLNNYSPSFEFLIFVTSIFYVLIISNFVVNNVNKNQYWISFLILFLNPYLFLIHLSAIRQTIAILIFVYSIKYIIKKDFLKYMLCIIVASNFHISAIILIPIYFFITDHQWPKEIFLILIIATIVVFTPYFYLFLEVLLNYFPKYRYYYENLTISSYRTVVLSSFFFFLTMKYLNKLEGKKIIYAKLYFLATVISIYTFKISMIMRIGMYFDIFMIVVIPNILEKIKSKTKRRVILIFIVSIFLIRYISFFNTEMWSKYFEYKTIFNIGNK